MTAGVHNSYKATLCLSGPLTPTLIKTESQFNVLLASADAMRENDLLWAITTVLLYSCQFATYNKNVVYIAHLLGQKITWQEVYKQWAFNDLLKFFDDLMTLVLKIAEPSQLFVYE